VKFYQVQKAKESAGACDDCSVERDPTSHGLPYPIVIVTLCETCHRRRSYPATVVIRTPQPP
jgi:hypothetical protein